MLILLMLFILVSNTSCDRHLKCQMNSAKSKVLWPLDHSGTASSQPHSLQVLLQGCTYEANSHESRWPRGRFTCFIWGTSGLWFFFWLSFLAGKLDPSISNSGFCWRCFFFASETIKFTMQLCESTIQCHGPWCQIAFQYLPGISHLCSWPTGPAWRISIQRHFPPGKLTCIREEPVDSSGVGNTAVFSIFSKAAANTANGCNSTLGWLDQNSWKSDLEGKHCRLPAPESTLHQLHKCYAQKLRTQSQGW